jgi:hypothetical protein
MGEAGERSGLSVRAVLPKSSGLEIVRSNCSFTRMQDERLNGEAEQGSCNKADSGSQN